jgi:exonuclease SbcD
MKILHTADWHIGQLFHGYDRTVEHQQFLDWLVNTVQNENIDVLLISGDVFDLSNPAATAIKQFYTFLNRAVKSNPALQIIVIAGNHDSAARLETPKPLLESSNIHIVGIVEKDETGGFKYDKLTIPLKDKEGRVDAWCIAVPFLRLGDYPIVTGSDNSYADGIAKFYEEAFQHTSSLKQDGQTIIAMGHLHARQAEISDMDKMERLIMGGVESISADAFHPDIAYVALGHIHKAQRIGGKDHIRYSGSPIPMSFSERSYKHQVSVFEVQNGTVVNIRAVEIPVTVPVLSVPEKYATLEEVIQELAKLPEAGENLHLAPYLEVRVLEDKPDPGRRHKVELAIEGKHVRLATINVKSTVSETDKNSTPQQRQTLDDLKPSEIFARVYESEYGNAVPDDMLQLFNQVAQEATQTEEV